MIDIISIENAHRYGDALPSTLKLRYRAFIARQSYDVPHFRDMEYDQYDTPAATYLVWRDSKQRVRGTSRILPTTSPYMIRDIWPDLVDSIQLPNSIDIWEASRFCIDKDLDATTRKRIHGELLCAFQEFALMRGIKAYIGVMSPPIWRCVFEKAAWPIEYLGSVKKLDSGENIVAGFMHISEQLLSNIRSKMHIPHNVFETDDQPILKVA